MKKNSSIIYENLVEIKKQIKENCQHLLFLNVSLVPNAFKCIYCGEELWGEYIFDIKEPQSPQNPILYSPKNPYFGYVGRAHTFYEAIRDEYLQIIKEIDEILNQRFIDRLKNLPSLTKRFARRKENSK